MAKVRVMLFMSAIILEYFVKAAIVNNFNQMPVYGVIDAPVVAENEQLVFVHAAAISQLTRLKAAGKHYSSGSRLPIVPGVDGVGKLADGQRVFFAFPGGPIGSMAEQVAVKKTWCVPVPDAVDDVTAAAIANPGMSSVAALECRAHFQPGEVVLINGAAGASGRLAIQLAKHMGAAKVIATARNPLQEPELRALGADAFICLQQPPQELTTALRDVIAAYRVDIVLDYLWGVPAECILNAVSLIAVGHGQKPLRFVNIGSLAGTSLTLNAAVLRAHNLELMGSGLGSVSYDGLINSIAKVLQWVEPAGLLIATQSMPLEQVHEAWQMTGPERMVLTL
tara:strand:- start:8167 stop:9180 length:1014 start_codon:yes stop_codon:yes gene_type:complete